MVCRSCQTENNEGARFCRACGASLALACPSCGAPHDPDQAFCDQCGTRLEAGASAAPPAVSAPELRVASVLFVDLVGYTPLSETRDAEDVRELLERLLRRAPGRSSTATAATVEKFIGDAVMAVWGVPVAREDDAERAVRAGLELVDAVARVRRGGRRAALQARAGVVTGQVAALANPGEGLVIGDRVNTAVPGAGRGRARHACSSTRSPARRPRRRSPTRTPASTRSRARRSRFACIARQRVAGGVAGTQLRDRARAAVRRPRRRAAADQGPLSRLRRPRGRAPGRGHRARPGSARRGSATELSTTTSTGSRTTSSGTPAAACPSATASPTGRSPRWSASGSGSPRTRRPRRPTRSSPTGSSDWIADPDERERVAPRRSARCSGPPSPGWRARSCSRAGGCSSSGSPSTTRSCSSSRTCSGPTTACSTSSSSCSTGRPSTRSSSAASPGPSSPSAAPAGRARSPTRPR